MMPPILSVHHLYRLLHLLLWIIWVCWEILLLRLQKRKRESVKGSVAVSGFQDEKVREVLKKQCEACGAVLLEVKPDIKIIESSLDGTQFIHKDHLKTTIHMLGETSEWRMLRRYGKYVSLCLTIYGRHGEVMKKRD